MKSRVLPFLVTTMVLLVACGSAVGNVTNGQDEAPTVTAVGAMETEAPPATAVEPTETGGAPPAVQTESVSIEAGDGLAMAGTLVRPVGQGPFPGVLLLHMLGSERGVWEDVGLVDALARAGFVVLAVDMRGHGETGGGVDWTQAGEDLVRIWEAFAERDEVDEARTAVVGASIGANLALRLGADVPQLAAVVMLSPGLDYRGVTTEDEFVAYGDRPVLMVASEDDPYSAESVNNLAERAEGDLLTQIYPSAGHGTNMLEAEPELGMLIVDWLSQYIGSE